MTYPKIEQAERAKKDAEQTDNRILRTYVESDSFEEFIIKTTATGDGDNMLVKDLKRFFEWKDFGQRFHGMPYYIIAACICITAIITLTLAFSVKGLSIGILSVSCFIGAVYIRQCMAVVKFNTLQRRLNNMQCEIEEEKRREERRRLNVSTSGFGMPLSSMFIGTSAANARPSMFIGTSAANARPSIINPMSWDTLDKDGSIP